MQMDVKTSTADVQITETTEGFQNWLDLINGGNAQEILKLDLSDMMDERGG